MKQLFLKGMVICLLSALCIAEAQAQRTSRRRGGGTTPPPTTDADNNTSTGNVGTVTQGSVIDPYANLPIKYDTTSLNSGSGARSLRNDNAFDKGFTTKRIPLAYENLRWDDALFAEKIWRELDLREKINQVFLYKYEGENGSEMFIDILMRAINKEGITAFEDEKFTTPIDSAGLSMLTAGRVDTSLQYDLNDINKVVGKIVTREQFDASTVTKIRLKEEWVFDKEAGKMFCRILGIAPIKVNVMPDGTERPQVMFWIYYPDLRPILATYEVYNPKNMGNSRNTWESLFESRMFSSYIIKSTLENPLNRTIRQYIKDPILALLEGENIKEKMFNYEQNLWSY